MEERTAPSRVAMHVTRGCLVVPIQLELHDELVLQIQRDILERVSRAGIKGVIIDVSGVDIMDSIIAQKFSDTVRMLSLLGAAAVLIGLRPGVVASLIDLDFEFKGVRIAINLEDAFRILEPVVWPRKQSEEIEEPEGVVDTDPESGADKAEEDEYLE